MTAVERVDPAVEIVATALANAWNRHLEPDMPLGDTMHTQAERIVRRVKETLVANVAKAICEPYPGDRMVYCLVDAREALGLPPEAKP